MSSAAVLTTWQPAGSDSAEPRRIRRRIGDADDAAPWHAR